MPERVPTIADVAVQIRRALESGDLSAFSDLLDPDMKLGAPGDPRPACQNSEQVIAWYERGPVDTTRSF